MELNLTDTEAEKEYEHTVKTLNRMCELDTRGDFITCFPNPYEEGHNVYELSPNCYSRIKQAVSWQLHKPADEYTPWEEMCSTQQGGKPRVEVWLRATFPDHPWFLEALKNLTKGPYHPLARVTVPVKFTSNMKESTKEQRVRKAYLDCCIKLSSDPEVKERGPLRLFCDGAYRTLKHTAEGLPSRHSPEYITIKFKDWFREYFGEDGLLPKTEMNRKFTEAVEYLHTASSAPLLEMQQAFISRCDYGDLAMASDQAKKGWIDDFDRLSLRIRRAMVDLQRVL